MRVYQHLEDELQRAGAGSEAILALTTTRDSATNLRSYFEITGKQANAETAVKVAGAPAKHCIVIHGRTAFLSGNGQNLDFDQECFTRANVAYSRATNLTILACPLNMQGMPGALQVLAALLHGVQTIHTNDTRKLTACGSLDLRPIQVSEATAAFQMALLPHDLWVGSLTVCLAEYHVGKVRRLRLVLANKSHLLTAEASCLQDGPHLPGRTAKHGLVFGYALDAVQTPEWLVIPEGQQSGHWRLLHNSTDPGRRCSVGCSKRYQPKSGAETGRKAQDYSFEALHRIYFYDAWRPEPVLGAPGSDLVLPPDAGLLVHGCYWPPQRDADAILSVSEVETVDAENPHHPPNSPDTTDATMAAGEENSIVSVPSSTPDPSTLPSSPNQAGTDSPPWAKEMTMPLFMRERVKALAIAPPPPMLGMKVMKRAVPYHRKEWIIMQMTPPPISRSLQSNDGLRPSRDPGDLNSKSSVSLHPSHWRTWQTCQPQCKDLQSPGTQPRRPRTQRTSRSNKLSGRKGARRYCSH